MVAALRLRVSAMEFRVEEFRVEASGDLLISLLGPGFRLHSPPNPKPRVNKPLILKGSWDLVSMVVIRITILITPTKGLITLNPKP